MTNSPGLSSGSMVMLDMLAGWMQRFSQLGGAEGEVPRLLTLLLLTGTEAIKREKKREGQHYAL